jgi:UDP-2-acetamido-2,6-beta-L-arabino-hexul-4-ose reductase
MKTILVTGSEGFIGRNLCDVLARRADAKVIKFDVSDSEETLFNQLQSADVVFHLAGINRPLHEDEFMEGNARFTQKLVDRLIEYGRMPLLVLSSSIQAELDNPYGKSKRKAEEELERYASNGGRAVIARLPNVFGKWSRPNYNSAVATFCHNVSRGLEITITDPKRVVELIYIDDVVAAFVRLLDHEHAQGLQWLKASPTFKKTLQELSDEIYALRDVRTALVLPDMQDRFRKALYATYLSFLPTDAFGYSLTKREDNRGALAELLKSHHFGQLFVSRTKPGFIRGNHFHHTKVEKFCVIDGEAIIRFRNVLGGSVISYSVKGDEFRVVDIPPGYTHSIENVGNQELIVLFWASEIFDPQVPDTMPLSVNNQE